MYFCREFEFLYKSKAMKEQRLQIITHIISHEVIRNQDDLIKALAKKGIPVTQATLSRDIKELKIVKKRDANNLYVYSLPEPASAGQGATDTELLNVEFSGNLAVVKTRPGYAMGIASDIDKHNPREIAGTIAGDDTILIIPREGYSREQVASALSHYINK
jgi:transcriptional regulator of arginine metabolism